MLDKRIDIIGMPGSTGFALQPYGFGKPARENNFYQIISVITLFPTLKIPHKSAFQKKRFYVRNLALGQRTKANSPNAASKRLPDSR